MKTFISTALFAAIASAQAVGDQEFTRITVDQWFTKEWQDDFCESFVPLPDAADFLNCFEDIDTPLNNGKQDAKEDCDGNRSRILEPIFDVAPQGVRNTLIWLPGVGAKGFQSCITFSRDTAVNAPLDTRVICPSAPERIFTAFGS